MKLFDTHTHYDDEKFDPDSRDTLLASLFREEVCLLVGAAINLASSRFTIATAAKYPGYYAAVGIHPENCGEYDDPEKALSDLEALTRADKVVAIGEIGLDYYWDSNPPKEVQHFYFERQLALAQKLSLPVIVHDREAHGAVMDTLIRYPSVTGVMHSFSGSVEMAKELLKRGWYISFSGVITYKNATRLAEVVRTVPLDRILVETDCPYLTPVPMRGRINHSGYVKYTAAKAAELRGEDCEAFALATVENGKRVFGISLG